MWENDLSKRYVLDNGSHHIRYQQKKTMNLIAQLRKNGQFMMQDELESVFDESSIIHYIKPLIRGVLVDFDKQIMLWEKLFNNMENSSLTMSYHPQTPEQVLNRCCEIMFEYFQLDAFCPLLSQQLISYYLQQEKQQQFQFIVESSHSATYLVPIFDNEIIWGSVRRIDVGGKLLTKQLKEIISFKQFDFKHYYLLSNQIKEEISYVSLDYKTEIKKPKNALAKYFILPDYEIQTRGYSIDKIDQGSIEAKICFDKERISVPELLFTPSDIGLNQKGPIESIMEIANDLPKDLGGYLLENVYLTGGNTFIKNYTERFQQDLRKECDQELNIDVKHISNKDGVYDGAVLYTNSDSFEPIRKKTYQEKGFNNLLNIYF